MSRFSRCLAFLVILQTILAIAHAQTAAVIPANLAASHVGEYATVEGVVAKVFTSKSGNTFLNIGASYPNQVFTWMDPARVTGLEISHTFGHRRPPSQNHWPNRDVQR